MVVLTPVLAAGSRFAMAGGSGRARGSRAAPNKVTIGDPPQAAASLVSGRFRDVALHGCGGRNRVAGIGGGSRANTNGTALQHSATSDGDACAADARPAFQHKPSTANVRRGRYGDERSPPQTRTASAPRDVMTTRLRGGPPR
ncbi:unnamed protein product, partial [Symbiodinium sp. CCMP2456]